MKKITVTGVPEHFNFPWLQVVEKQPFLDEGIQLVWKNEPKGSGAMNKSLRDGETDIAIVLTESFIKDKTEGNPALMIGFHIESPLIWGIHGSARSEIDDISQLGHGDFVISRYGSGSHLMAFLLAKREGWNLDNIDFDISNTESDILGDGSLDYDDETLATFDLVIASVHSNLKMNEEKAMMRVMNAIENPFTTILGHMTGRLLLSRAGYPLDHKKIIDACVANSVVIELNAHPRRLDIDWRWIPYALEKGALLSINPDAHELSGYNDVKYGTLAAQKGRLTASRNLSSFSLREFEEYIMDVRMEKGI